MQHVVVIGGGFGGQRVARGLRHSPVRVTLIDHANHHCFQPLLYQVATGTLSPGEIAPPHRWVLRRQTNATFHMAHVEHVDLAERRIDARTADGEPWTTQYDHLVVAAGARHSYFGNDEWEQHAPGLKTIDDALELHERIFGVFERADIAATDAERRRLLTFVVIGAGPTGVELAGQLLEIARTTLRREYRRFDPADARVVLVDAGPRVLGGFDARLSERARQQLEEMGIEVRLDAPVKLIDEQGVTIGEERIPAGCVIWAAGVQGTAIGAQVATAAGVELARGGRIQVDEHLRIAGADHDNVYVIGDLAASGLPGVAPVAMQQGEWVAHSIDAYERRRPAPAPFRYRDKGSLATIGKRRAVAQIGKLRLSGTIAWLAWVFVHLMYVVGFANRVLVFVRWASAYLAGGRGERVLVRTIPNLESPPE